MPRGGRRDGAGRPNGSKNKATQAREWLQDEAARKTVEEGMMPLAFLLEVMRDEGQPQSLRMEAAKAAAPYCHSRLSQVTLDGELSHRYVAEIPAETETPEEWEQQVAGRA